MTSLKKSPLAPASFPDLKAVPGVTMGVASTGQYKGRANILLATFDEGTTASGVFTLSQCPSAPVLWSKEQLMANGGTARALVVNAGNSNAFTGFRGDEEAQQTAAATAKIVGCSMQDVMLASTGVIGEILDATPICNLLPNIYSNISNEITEDAALSICTTDTYAKGSSRTATIDGHEVVLSGFAKGSGMIAPNMATMLGFIFTNAAISNSALNTMLKDSVDMSFNSITVDSDTSTSDTVFVFATGKNANPDIITDASDPHLDDFKMGLKSICLDLAHQIVRDGEGASKFVTIEVKGAQDDRAAKVIAMSIANSPLMKTAIAGEDPNWGRLIMAVGKAGERANRDKISIWIGEQHVAQNGLVRSEYKEEIATKHMQGQDVSFTVDVGIAQGAATVWTCDLTHGYISINADYRS